MSEEFNVLSYDNTKITFTNNVDNTATSDELSAPLMYQDKMGTNYSRSKAVARMFNVAGISLILTAAAIKTGTIISNVFILNPPSVSEENRLFEYTDEGVKYQFTVANPGGYEVFYYLIKDGEEIFKEDCSKEETYEGTYSDFTKGQKLDFYVKFTNGFDYAPVIWHKTLK